MQLTKTPVSSVLVAGMTLLAPVLPARAQATVSAPTGVAANSLPAGATAFALAPAKAGAEAATTGTTKNPADEAFQAMVRRNREQNLRDFLAVRGVADPATQNALVASVARQEQARAKLRDLGNKLFIALSTPAPPQVAEVQLKKLTEDYQRALDDFQAQQRLGQQDLEKQLQVSKNVRLQGVLMVLGVTEDAPPLLPSWGVPGTTTSLTSK